MSNPGTLTTGQRAALFVLGLEESVAAELMRHLADHHVRALARIADELKGGSTAELEPVYLAFERDWIEPLLPRAGGAYLRQLAENAFGAERAQRLFIDPPAEPRAIEALKNARAGSLATLLQEEPPQIAAAILSQLPKDHAARLLEMIPASRQVDLVARIATLTSVPRDAIDLASEALLRSLEAMAGPSDGKSDELDGYAFAASVLNELEAADSERILGGLQETHEAIVPKVREAMFTFEDLERLSVRALQVLMREVQSEQLLLALKTASDSLREHFLAAVSSRAAATLREDLAAMPPTRLSEVERTQREIVETAMRLASDGRLVLPTSGSEELV